MSSFYWPDTHERVRNLTDCARFCKDALWDLFVDMTVAVIEALLGEDEFGESDRGEELDSEGYEVGDYSEEEYDH